MSDHRYVVTIRWPEPVIHTERVTVEANSPGYALLLARQMRASRGWPQGCVFSARAVDDSSYAPPWDVCSSWALFGELPQRKAMEIQHHAL